MPIFAPANLSYISKNLSNYVFRRSKKTRNL